MSTGMQSEFSEIELNPYAAPRSDIAPSGLELGEGQQEYELIRKTYLGHEASIKSLGTLHYLGAFFGALATVGLFVALFTTAGGNAENWGTLTGIAVFYAMLTALNIALGRGLQRLRPWARWTEVVVIGFGTVTSLFSAGIGLVAGMLPLVVGYGFVLLFQGYLLYLFLSAKGSMVFSPEYRTIVEKTPYLKYKTSLLVKLLVGLLVLVIVFALLGALFFRR